MTEGLWTWIAGLFAAWTPVAEPRRGPVLSRRERVCRRDGIAVWSGAWGRT